MQARRDGRTNTFLYILTFVLALLAPAGHARAEGSEAERLVATEHTQLDAIEDAQAKFATSLEDARRAIAERRETTLGLQRRAGEARLSSALPSANPPSADALYDEIRRNLHGGRDALSAALDALSASTSDVPAPGPDLLSDSQIAIDTAAVRSERAHLVTAAAALALDERAVRDERVDQLVDEVGILNRERLALIPFLTSDKRQAITGFTSAGLDQAGSEVRQLALVLRYHRHVVAEWIASLRHPDRSLGRVVVGGVPGLLAWLVVIGAFVTWRRRAPVVLRAWRARIHELERADRRASPSLFARTLAFAIDVRAPLEWLVLLFVLSWLLPLDIQAILEVRVAFAIATWTFGAAFVVEAINSFAATSDRAGTASLRLRSLRLVGRTIVVFGLVLAISSMVVGHGTIYRWILSTCWLASLPILLLLVRWWRDVVFQRTENVRKKSPFQQWVLAHRVGWTSVFAATAGGIHLFVNGAVRASRSWAGRFDVTRRFLAYLFRRELTKLGTGRGDVEGKPIAEAAFVDLGPATSSSSWITTDVDDAIRALVLRIGARQGGIVAVVGERGLGKTNLFDRMEGSLANTYKVPCPTTGLQTLRSLLAKHTASDLDAAASLEEYAAAIDRSTVASVLLDDAHHFVRPVIGGLVDFDTLIAILTRHAHRTVWVLAFDEVIWQFLERSRSIRPTFDEVVRLAPWREEEIVRLLEARTAQAGLSPSFEHLLDRLPANADEIDKQEAIARRASDYYRLLWDYAYGNPGVALHMWRRSLGVDTNGQTAVRLFTAMDPSDLERLPDRAIFVLRAVLQLAPARPEQIVHATMLAPNDVADALRYASARGYIEDDGDGYRATWTWFRTLTLFLQRRHLLVLR